jgi:hypothetical protein
VSAVGPAEMMEQQAPKRNGGVVNSKCTRGGEKTPYRRRRRQRRRPKGGKRAGEIVTCRLQSRRQQRTQRRRALAPRAVRTPFTPFVSYAAESGDIGCTHPWAFSVITRHHLEMCGGSEHSCFVPCRVRRRCVRVVHVAEPLTISSSSPRLLSRAAAGPSARHGWRGLGKWNSQRALRKDELSVSQRLARGCASFRSVCTLTNWHDMQQTSIVCFFETAFVLRLYPNQLRLFCFR